MVATFFYPHLFRSLTVFFAAFTFMMYAV